MKKARAVLWFTGALPIAFSSLAQPQDLDQHQREYAATITTDPAVFQRDRPFTARATFTIRNQINEICEGKILVLQAYNYDPNKNPEFDDTATPSHTSKSLAKGWSLDPIPAEGIETTVAFQPLKIPLVSYDAVGNAVDVSDRLHLVVYQRCEIRIPTGLVDPQGNLIKKVIPRIAAFAEATATYRCNRRRFSKAEVCGYRVD